MTAECSSSSDILKYVICTNPESSLGEDDLNVQAGLVVADTSKQSILFMQEEEVAMFKDIRTAAQYLRVDDGVKKCLVGHYLALQEDVFSLGQMSQADDTGYPLRVRTAEEINNHLTGKSSKMLEIEAFWASRLLLEVTHDMVVDVASDVLEEKTVELKTCEGLPDSPVSPCFLSMSCLETETDKCPYGDECSNSDECSDSDEQASLEKLLQVKKSIITQIESLSSKVESSPPSAYKRRNCDELEQLESVSSEEVEWIPVKKITSLGIDPFSSSSQKNVSREAFDQVSSDDIMECQSQCVPTEVKDLQSGKLSSNEALSRKRKRKRKKKSKETKGKRLIVEGFDEVSSEENLDCLSHSVPTEVDLQNGILRTHEGSYRKRKRKRRIKKKMVKDGLKESLDKVSSDDNLDDFYNPSLSEDGELVNSSD